ncbi:MAG: hypothetical protein LBS19_13985 [Clostridiales bacterium]|jgi:hypothetical protein|nr:hypothetical protein [Clostridiales bacterium]
MPPVAVKIMGRCHTARIDIRKELNMQKTQMLFQKIVIFGCIAIGALTLVYSLGFSTDIYSLFYHSDPTSGLFYVPGAEMYFTVQPYNRELFTHSVLFICVAVTLFMTLTHRRRLYYISNFVTSLGFSSFSGFLGFRLFAKATEYIDLYKQVDFEKMEQVTTMMKMELVNSTLMLDLGRIFAVLLIIWAALTVFNLVFKMSWQLRERWAPEQKTEVA